MSHGIVPHASQFSFIKNTKFRSIQITNSMFESCSCLSFNTHLPKIGHSSLRIQSGSFRKRPITASDQRLCPKTESFYDLLGIPETVSPREIKQAYKQLVLKYHPDVSPPDRIEENTKRFIRLQEAYETLSDPKSRALYDSDVATDSFIAFSARKPSRYKEGLEKTGEWKIQWMSQLTELKRRRMNKDLRNNLSWAGRIRGKRSKTTDVEDHDWN